VILTPLVFPGLVSSQILDFLEKASNGPSGHFTEASRGKRNFYCDTDPSSPMLERTPAPKRNLVTDLNRGSDANAVVGNSLRDSPRGANLIKLFPLSRTLQHKRSYCREKSICSSKCILSQTLVQ
jgi:hypothetical protein